MDDMKERYELAIRKAVIRATFTWLAIAAAVCGCIAYVQHTMM